MAMSRYSANKTGFTLVEMLVTVTITALIAATAAGTLRAAAWARNRIDADIEIRSEARFVADLIQRDLHNLYRDRDAKNIKLVGKLESVAGRSQSVLTMHTVDRFRVRPGEPEGDVREVEYVLIAQKGKKLLLRRTDPHPEDKEEPGGRVAVIAENVAAFEVSFYDDREQEWLEEWPEEKNSLPKLAAVNLAVRRPDRGKSATQSFIVSFPRWPAK